MWGNTIPPNILLGERSPKYYQDKGNGDTVAFPEIGLQRSEKSIKS